MLNNQIINTTYDKKEEHYKKHPPMTTTLGRFLERNEQIWSWTILRVPIEWGLERRGKRIGDYFFFMVEEKIIL